MKRERAFGINAVEALLQRHPERVIQLWLDPKRERAARLGTLARPHGIAVEQVRAENLDRLAGGGHHQGAVAEFRPVAPLAEGELLARIEQAGSRALLLVLDQVQDPHNLGACLRSAAAAGCTAVVIPRDRAAGLTPAVRSAAAGAAEIVPLCEVANLARAMDQWQKAGLWCTGLAGEAESDLYDLDLTGPLALVLGGEEKGLRRLTRERCDNLARIPMPGPTESLNVSVAAGIALFEALRQRRT
ncbi:MAG: 23S rRNA (guanosine(2251)-2'-O)-methyltransferase RlmB [Wenzhouxiangellaceae bacterium]